jgi:enoyl-CoA hydratase
MLARGFLTRVVADDALADHTQATLLRMSALSPLAARLNKQTFRDLIQLQTQSPARVIGVNVDAEAGLATADPYSYASHAEHREGITAFLEKRPPAF